MSAPDMHPIVRDEASAEWFDAAAYGRLLIRQCPCGAVLPPQAVTCPECGSTALQWIEASRRGRIVTYAVVHRRGTTVLPVAIVELDEGPWMRMQLRQVDPDALVTGMPVEMRFARPDGGEPIPYAVPVKG